MEDRQTRTVYTEVLKRGWLENLEEEEDIHTLGVYN